MELIAVCDSNKHSTRLPDWVVVGCQKPRTRVGDWAGCALDRELCHRTESGEARCTMLSVHT